MLKRGAGSVQPDRLLPGPASSSKVAQMAVDERTMFEIFREGDYNRSFHYIFYTDLEEHARDDQISKA
ncbi:MAG: hypothetical protein KUG77_12890, partial [Nannocystaceae bacterium]|nr:hypothetical protein [Nannocystaceae bacterium]